MFTFSVYFHVKLCLLGHVDENFQFSTRRDTEDWVYLNAKGDRGTEYAVVLDCLGGVVTCTYTALGVTLPIGVTMLPKAMIAMLEEYSVST